MFIRFVGNFLLFPSLTTSNASVENMRSKEFEPWYILGSSASEDFKTLIFNQASLGPSLDPIKLISNLILIF